jgi:pimeloyl-ACP methyl ester carboxylesterase
MNMKKLILFVLSIVMLTAVAAAQKSEMNDKYAKYGDIKVHYTDEGKGKNALVFVHGWTCDLTFWQGQYSAVPGTRMIFIDLPGHGKSDKPKADYTMEYFARSIDAVMHDAGVKKAVLVGHSMGTPVIRNFYKFYPEKTLGLVIVDGPLRQFIPKAQAAAFIGMLKADYKKNSVGVIESMVSKADASIQDHVRSTMLATPDYVAISAMESMSDDKSYPQEKITVPVLAIMTDSGTWPADNDEYMHSVTDNLKIHKWQGVSHFLMMEKPQVFNQSLGIFLATNHLLD